MAGSVRHQRYVMPLSERHALPGADLNGIIRPMRCQPDRQQPGSLLYADQLYGIEQHLKSAPRGCVVNLLKGRDWNVSLGFKPDRDAERMVAAQPVKLSETDLCLPVQR